MSNEPQIIYVQQPQQQQGGCISLIVIGLLAVILLVGWIGFRVANTAVEFNQVPIVVNESMTRMAATPTAYSAPVVEPTQQPDYQATINAIQAAPTATLAPTQTAVPLIRDYGLPNVGPYSLDEVQQCQDIKASSGLNVLPSPQLELCQMYTRGG